MKGGLSIRLRLSLWYSGVLLAGLALFGLILWISVRQSLMTSLDETLDQRIRGAITVFEEETRQGSTAATIREELGEYADSIPEGRLLKVTGPDGQRVFPLESVPPLPRHGYRFRRKTDYVAGRRYEFYAAGSLDGVENLMGSLRWLMLWTAPLTLLAASLGGYWISRRALAPVDALTTAARTIGIGNLSSRLAVPATGDELERLAATWNQMLERLESAVHRLTQFTADASHELRTPIALMRTSAEIALRRPRTAEDYRESLQQIMDEAERTSRLVDDLLTLSRADAGRAQLSIERLDLVPLVSEVCEQGRMLASSRGLEIDVDLPGRPVEVEGNAPALRRLLFILLDNALKYTQPGGNITVSVSGSGPVTVSVSDTGVGIAADVLPHVFERFFRADPSRQRDAGGSGLGLSIAKWIAERHHATIDAESAVKQGSTFHVRFPGSNC